MELGVLRGGADAETCDAVKRLQIGPDTLIKFLSEIKASKFNEEKINCLIHDAEIKDIFR